MPKKKFTNELDFILDILINEYEQMNEGVGFYQGCVPKTTNEYISEIIIDKFGLKKWEINVLFHQLLVDKYISSTAPLTISLDGIVFRANGGYTEKHIRDELESIRIKTIESDMKKYSFGLMVFTGIVAIGTLISAVYFFLEIWKHFIQ